MSVSDYFKQVVSLHRPTAKFAAYAHSSEFIEPQADVGDGFFHVHLYDERIDSNVIRTPRGPILIHNSYLPSFAYNLLLCWLLCAGQKGRAAPAADLALLLRHNFKKFYAEQLLHKSNNMFSRAVFLETLLFEQVCMVPVFQAKATDPELGRKAGLGSQLMSSAVSFHELGHFFLGRKPQVQPWVQLLGSVAETIRPLLERVGGNYPAPFVEEFMCDVVSVAACLNQYEGDAGREFCLRAIAFAFAVFAVFASLTKSAEKTVQDQSRIVEVIDFESIEKRDRTYDFTIGIDRDFVERARLVIEACELLGEQDGLDLFNLSGPFPLPATILDDLLACAEGIMESKDRNAREMSLLVAEALHEHPRGLRYLYLRSKTFSFGSQRNPDGSFKVV